MSLLLAIETSSDEFRVMLGREGEQVFDSARGGEGVPPRDLAALVSRGLEHAGARAGEIDGIALNVGPGGLSYVRAGVAFANALAFSLGAPVYPFNYFEIVAAEAGELTALPVVCAVPAANDYAYVALSRGASVEVMRFGPLGSVVAEVCKGLRAAAVAGRIRQRLTPLLDGAEVFDTGIQRPSAGVLLALGSRASARGEGAAAQVSPLNDQSEIFYE